MTKPRARASPIERPSSPTRTRQSHQRHVYSLGETSLDELLLLGRHAPDGVDLRDALRAELDVGRKVLDALVLVQRRLDERGLDDARLAVHGADERVGEAGAGWRGAERQRRDATERADVGARASEQTWEEKEDGRSRRAGGRREGRKKRRGASQKGNGAIEGVQGMFCTDVENIPTHRNP
jgi:hypothetical protein